jgi:hypothetical protein
LDTTPIKRLVEEVLLTLPKPRTEDVIDDVFYAIEQRPEWLQQYNKLSNRLGKKVVNTLGGFWIAHLEGKSGQERASVTKSSLIHSYSKLDKPANKPGKKAKEAEALQSMSQYYREHRATLPSSIVDHRLLIVDLLMMGFTADEAFSQAQTLNAELQLKVVRNIS